MADAGDPNDPPPLVTQRITSSKWMKIVGASFGFLTMCVFLGLGVMSAFGWAQFSCSAFSFLAAAFAIGAAMTAAFLGGGAAIDGNLGEVNQVRPLRVVVGGGAAMLVVMLLAFLVLRPADCSTPEPRTAVQLQFDGIPLGLRASAGTEAWSKTARENDLGNLTILLDEAKDRIAINLMQGAERVCHLHVRVKPAFQNADSEDFEKIGFDLGNKLHFVYGLGERIPQQAVDDCFLRDSKIVPRILEVSLGDKQVRFRKLDQGILQEPSGAFEFETGSIDPEPTLVRHAGGFGLISAAHAEVKSGADYDELRAGLETRNDVLRVEARRILGAGFAGYADQAIQDLFDPANQDNGYLLSSLLHGVIDGIATNQPGLKPASGRNLAGVALPYVNGHEQALVQMTGHADEQVRKQARRLIQRYPVDAFAPHFDAAQATARENCTSETLAWQIYAQSFYVYNRLIQAGLNTQLTVSDAQNWDQDADMLRQAAEACGTWIETADIGIIDYGRALAYGWSKQLDSTVSKTAAQDFIDWVEGREAAYYKQSHIVRMRSSL